MMKKFFALGVMGLVSMTAAQGCVAPPPGDDGGDDEHVGESSQEEGALTASSASARAQASNCKNAKMIFMSSTGAALGSIGLAVACNAGAFGATVVTAGAGAVTFPLCAPFDAAAFAFTSGALFSAVNVAIQCKDGSTLGTAAPDNVFLASAGNQADTGIKAEAVSELGNANWKNGDPDLCSWLQAEFEQARRSSDSKRAARIKATQKAMGCRQSRWK